jgi:hypothetical protein
MASDKQSEGKQRSAGPKTARPTVRYGLSRLVLSTESEADFQSLLDSYEAEHKPSTATEKALVSQLASTTWRLRRLHNIEASLYKLNAASRDRSGPLGLVADGSDKALTILARQQARLERSFHKALRELQRLRARRTVKVASPGQKAPAVAQPKPHYDRSIPVMTNIPRS